MNTGTRFICVAALVAWIVLTATARARSEDVYTVKYAEIKPTGDGRYTLQFKEKKVTLDGLLKEMKDQDDDVRLNAVRAIAWPEKWPKKDTKQLIRSLAERLKDDGRGIRYHSAEALSRLGEDALLALDELMEAAKDKSELVRSRALCAVSQIGPKAKAAIPKLITALEDEFEPIAGTAALALGILV
jgi:hypothetical protein